MKRCSKCLEEKPLDQYGKDNRTLDCRTVRCKDCRNASARKNYRTNPELSAARNKAWKESHKLEIRKYSQSHKMENRKSSRAWYANNPNKARISSHRRRVLTSDPIPVDTWDRLIVLYGEHCLYPGCLEVIRLELDHIIPLSIGGPHSFENFQILCKHHNTSKGNRNSIDYRPTV